jgi:hypothetical protein
MPAEDSVIVMIHEVATKPSRHRTKNLPRQNGSRSSSIAIEPWPLGALSRDPRDVLLAAGLARRPP